MVSATALGVIVALVAGIAGGMQIAANGALGRRAGVLEAAAFAGLLAMVTMLAVLLMAHGGLGAITRVSTAPPWFWIGGLMSAVFVIGVTYAVPRIGIVATMALLIVGQLGMGVLIDALGWFGLAQISVSPARLTGVLLVLAGAYLVLDR